MAERAKREMMAKTNEIIADLEKVTSGLSELYDACRTSPPEIYGAILGLHELAETALTKLRAEPKEKPKEWDWLEWPYQTHLRGKTKDELLELMREHTEMLVSGKPDIVVAFKQPHPCKTCGGLKVVCKDGIGLIFGGIAEACPDCQKGD